jgi:hypothetical protein
MLLASSLGQVGWAGSTVLQTGDADFNAGKFNQTTVLGKGALASLKLKESWVANWTLKDPGAPAPRLEAAMAYDSVNDVTVLFGGWYFLTGNLDVDYGDTWVYYAKNNTWRNMHPANPPPSSNLFMMGFDSDSGLIVVFGGSKEHYVLNWTYTYDYKTNVWTRIYTTTAPPDRLCGKMTYDSRNKQMVLWGGIIGIDTWPTDLWLFNMSTKNWTQRTSATAPHGRLEHGWSYDASSGLVVLFGGRWYEKSYTTCLHDTWTYNVATNVWTEKTPAVYPSTRHLGVMVYDSVNRQSLIYGGMIESKGFSNETWTYDSTANVWTQLYPSNNPWGRDDISGVYDSASKAMLVFGGRLTEFVPMDALWSYDPAGKSWTNLTPQAGPSALKNSAIALDPQTGKVLLFGGRNADGISDRTWVYDVSTGSWSDPKPATHPPATNGHFLGFNSRTGDLFLVSVPTGVPDATVTLHTYNVTNNIWKSLAPANPPSHRSMAGVAFNTRRNTLVMFGGMGDELSRETWLYDFQANAWYNRTPPIGPSARYGAGMVYDPTSDNVLLFGGSGEWMSQSRLSDTWEYNVSSNTWANVTASNVPPGRFGHGMVCIPQEQALLVFSGDTGFPKSDLWRYDITSRSWTDITRVHMPASRAWSAMASDPSGSYCVLFGGFCLENYGYETGDTWTLEPVKYPTTGSFESKAIDSGGRPYFDRLVRSAIVPAYTKLAIQLRSGPDIQSLSKRNYSGPDGGATSYYESYSQKIWPGHNGDRFVQYKVLMWTSDRSRTPVLDELRISFNLIHSGKIVSPNGNEVCAGAVDIRWSATDPDGDTLSLDILISQDGGTTFPFKIASGLPVLPARYSWDTTLFPNGNMYMVKIIVRDNNATVPLVVEDVSDATFAVDNPKPPNFVPKTENLSPANGQTVNSTSVELSWTGTDDDWDSLKYFIFLDSTDGRTLIAVQTEDRRTIHNLENGKTYFWTIIPNDGKENGTCLDGILKFTIDTAPKNNAPYAVLSGPPDGATINTTSVNLTWTGHDGDGDNLLYFVMVDDGNGMHQAGSVTKNGLELSGLKDKIQYSWTVVPFDGKANGTCRSGIWRFNVSLQGNGPGPNRPPVTRLVRPSNAAVVNQTTVTLAWSGEDPDSDALQYYIFMDNLNGLKPAGKTRLTSVTLPVEDGKTYYWRVIPNDGKVNGSCASGTWNFKVDLRWGDTRPRCAIAEPLNESVVSGILQVTGTASGHGKAISMVQVRMDDGPWTLAKGTGNWTLKLDTTRLKNGNHTIMARSSDGTQFSDICRITVIVGNSGNAGGGWDAGRLASELWYLWMAIAAAAAVCTVWMVRRRKNGR